jgi:hypothetical protein
MTLSRWMLVALCLLALVSCVNGVGGATDRENLVIITFHDINKTIGFPLPPEKTSANYSFEANESLLRVEITPIMENNLTHYSYKISKNGRPYTNVSINEPISSQGNSKSELNAPINNIDNDIDNFYKSIWSYLRVALILFIGSFIATVIYSKIRKGGDD